MAAIAAANIKVETEGDLQVIYCTVAAVTNGDTTTFVNFFKKVYGIGVTSSTAGVPFGATESAGVVTWKCATNILGAATTSNLIVRVAGH